MWVGPQGGEPAALQKGDSLLAELSRLDAALPWGKWGGLELWFFRSYSNALPTQSVRESCFQLPHSALRRPGTPVLSAEQWHVIGSREERRDRSGGAGWAAAGAPSVILPALHCCGDQGHPRMPFRPAEGRGPAGQ